MGSPQENTALSGYQVASLDFTNAKRFRDYFDRSRRLTIKHQAQRHARYELLKVMFEREYQCSENYVQGLDVMIAGYENQMNQSTSEMLESMGGVS